MVSGRGGLQRGARPDAHRIPPATATRLAGRLTSAPSARPLRWQALAPAASQSAKGQRTPWPSDRAQRIGFRSEFERPARALRVGQSGTNATELERLQARCRPAARTQHLRFAVVTRTWGVLILTDP